MKAGDIVLFTTNGPGAWLIRLSQRMRGLGLSAVWTHVAFAVSDSEIVEAVFRGVRKREYPEPDDLGVVFHVYASPEDTQEAVKYALSTVGEEYGVLSILSIALALFTGGKIVLAENRHLICSQLVGEALERIGVIWDKDTSELTPGDIAVWCKKRAGYFPG